MTIAMIAPSDLPIPATKGGAVETGIQQIIDENEKERKVQIVVFSFYDELAYRKSCEYKNTKFVFYKANKFDYLNKIILKSINFIFRKIKFKKQLCINYKFLKFIINNIKYSKIDKILIKNCINYVLPLRKNTNSQIYLQLHNDFLNANVYKAEKIVDSCDGLIANSEYIKKCILTINNAKENKIMINKNCLDDSDFIEVTENEINEKARKYNIDITKKNILFSGRIVQQKGIKELIQAVQLLDNRIDWNLVIVGSKTFGKTVNDKFLIELKELSQKNKERIKFIGFVSHSDIKFLNKMADIVVIPSMWEEPAGRVALEAQVQGTPIIISNSGGLVEYTNDLSSIIIERNSYFIENLTKAIAKLLLDDKLRDNMGKEAKKFCLPYNSKYYYYEILEELGLRE